VIPRTVLVKHGPIALNLRAANDIEAGACIITCWAGCLYIDVSQENSIDVTACASVNVHSCIEPTYFNVLQYGMTVGS